METRILLRFAVVFLIIAILLFLLSQFWLILMPFIVAYILHFALKPCLNFLEQRDIKHTYAVTIVFVVFFGILVLFLRFFIPAIASELLGIQDNLPEYSQALSDKISRAEKLFLGKFGMIVTLFDKQGYDFHELIESYMTDTLLVLIRKIPGFLFNILPLILYILVIPFATFFFLLDDMRIKKFIISLVPNRYFETTLNLLYGLNRQFGWLLRGMFISAVIISTLASTGLWIIGLEYPILVGIFAGLANLIPYVGPIAGTIAAFIVALMTRTPSTVETITHQAAANPIPRQDPSIALLFLFIILVFLIVNLIDNVLVQPLVLARAANLHPLVVIFLVLLGSRVGGILGMLVAVPLVSILQVVFKILYKELARPLRPDFSKYKDIDISPANNLHTKGNIIT